MSQHKGKIAAAIAALFLLFYLIAVYWSIGAIASMS